MNTYIAIYEDELNNELLSEVFGDENVYHFSETSSAIQTLISTVSNITELATKAVDGEPTVVVFKLNGSYSGRYYKEFWEWMKRSRVLELD